MLQLGMAAEAGVAGGAAAGLDLLRGAIAGGLFIAIAYLAGFAVFRRSAAAVCALLMVASATAMLLAEIGLIRGFQPGLVVMLQGLFGASALVFLSSAIRVAQNNRILGGAMFLAALGLIAVAVINVVAGGGLAGVMQVGLVGVGALAVVLALSQAFRDDGARLILPGALIAALSPFADGLFGGGLGAIAGDGLFALGVISASLVALAHSPAPRVDGLGLHADEPGRSSFDPFDDSEERRERMMRVSENQLAQVLDYSGVAVWDWSPLDAHQTEGLPTLMGADSRGVFTPETFGAFIHKDDAQKFEKKVLGPGEGDGAFDIAVKLHDGRRMRFRGARAVADDGSIERLVAFIEPEREGRTIARAAVASAAPAASLKVSEAGAAPAAPQNPLAAEIGAALDAGRIKAAFQPIVSLEDGRVAGFETLARWPDEKGGPDRAGAEDLVKAAEEAGRAGDLSRLVLKAACDHLKGQSAALDRDDLFVALNLSVAQLKDDALVEDIRKAVEANGLKPRSLILEVTETQAISEYARAGDRLRELSGAGAALAFDDFGAGFSSLANLKDYAFDYLKIDKSFIAGLAEGGEGARIARAIAGLATDLGLTVIAEGVEDAKTAEAAREIGCKFAQGYEFGAPAAPDSAQPEAGARKGKRSLFGSAMR